MNGMMGKLGRFLLVLLLIGSVSACAKKPVTAQPGFGSGSTAGGTIPGGGSGSGMGMGAGLDDARWRELGITSEAEKREFLAKADQFENQDVYFDYDAYVLSAPAKKVLDEKVEFLKRYPKVKVIVEGHCDARGTTEYNLALGERRANSAYQYVLNSGANAASLSSISYGKERPIATGNDEASWARNRRAHFQLNY